MENKEDKSSFYIHQPRLRELGFDSFNKLDISGGLFSLPTFLGIRINYVYNGLSHFKGTLKGGDIVVAGFTSEPMYGHVKNFSFYSIQVRFSLFYKLTGLTPADCRKPFIVHRHAPLYDLLLKFFEMPVSYWERYTNEHLVKMAPRLSNALNKRMERICLAINAYSHPSIHNFHDVAYEMQISYRQLQRDFASFFGMTPVEYERTIRFYRAAENLKTMSLSKAALISGYYDQAHMAKEFRVLSGRTPLEIRRLETLELPQIHNCDRPISSCISI